MGRAPCCDKATVKRGPWSPEEDLALKNYIQAHGTGGNWIALPHKAGLKRCGKSCRLRWLNYLRPDIKHGGFTEEEDNVICSLYNNIGSRWSIIASQLPGRTDNDVKNYWNTKLKKKLLAKTTAVKSSNNNNSNSHIATNGSAIHMSFTQFPAAAVPKIEIYNCGNSDWCNPNSCKLSYSTDVIGYQQKIDPQVLALNQHPIQVPLPSLMEVSDLGMNSKGSSGYSASSSQEVSSLSASSSLALESNHASWTGNGGGGEDKFPMDFCFESPYDLVNGSFFQENIGEVAPIFGNSPYMC